MFLKRLKFPIWCAILGIILLLVFGFSVSLGAVKIPYEKVYELLWLKLINNEQTISDVQMNILWQLRFPRIFMAMIVGVGLSLCGVVMQAMVQNPLADPFIIGVSSGGYLGAVVFIMVGTWIPFFNNNLAIELSAFLGALVASLSVLFLSSYKSKISTTKLILSGMIVNAAFQAIANFLVALLGNQDTITRISFWTMGSLSSIQWNDLTMPLVLVFLSFIFFWSQYRQLNAFLQGDEIAITLGLNVHLLRTIYIIIVSLIVGFLVSKTGIIGFVGLIVPHIGRAIFGSNHKYLIPISCLLGAIFMMIADTVSRSLMGFKEFPIGIFTSLIGAIFFAYIMIKKNYSYSN